MRFIVDGHEYRTRFYSPPGGPNRVEITNNYGSVVAEASEDSQGYWYTAPLAEPSHSTSIHRSKLAYEVEQWAVLQYVAWAEDRDTVEGH